MDKVKELLRLSSYQETLGTSADSNITTITDYDLQEFIDYNNKSFDLYEKIRQEFIKKYDKVNESNDLFITDFKAGFYNAKTPLHWDYKTLKQGYQIKEGRKIFFNTILQQESIIKLDLIALIDNKFNEFSENYYFCFDGTCTYKNSNIQSIAASLYNDVIKYKSSNKSFKSLKRYYSLLKLLDKPPKRIINKLINFFNSSTGHLNSIISNLHTLDLLLDTHYSKVKLIDLINNVNLFNLDSLDSLINVKTKKQFKLLLDKVIKQLESQVEKQTNIFIDKLK